VAKKPLPARPVVRYRPVPKYPFPRVRYWLWQLNPFNQLRTTANQRAYSGDNRWLAIIVGLYLFRSFRRSLRPLSRIVYMEAIEPGQTVTLQAGRPPSRAERKAAKRR
jgi:hypothetical protein